MLRAVLDPLFSLAFPRQCNVCETRDCGGSYGAACSECWAATHLFSGDELLCDKCGAYFGPIRLGPAIRCHKCDDHAYDRAFAAGIYEKALAADLLYLKRTPKLSDPIKAAIDAAMTKQDLSDVEVVIPVPLAKMRRIERGFNQAEIIGELVGRSLGIPTDNYSLSRKIHTPLHRIGMDDRARELTVQKAFEVKRPKLIEGRCVLLVDDVLTSGATTSACAAVLKKKGAGKVIVFTVARATLNKGQT